MINVMFVIKHVSKYSVVIGNTIGCTNHEHHNNQLYQG